MAEYSPKLITQSQTVITKLRKISCTNDGEFWGGSEPYLTAIYFQLDGENLKSTINIDITTEKLLQLLVGKSKVKDLYSFYLEGTPKVYSPSMPKSNNEYDNLDWNPTGIESKFVPTNIGTYESTLKPIPIQVNSENKITISLGKVLNVVLNSISSKLEYELDFTVMLESFTTDCKRKKIRFDDYILNFIFNNIIGGVPPVIGVIYILNEHDALDDDIVRGIKREVVREVEFLLQDIIDKMGHDLFTKIDDKTSHIEVGDEKIYILNAETIFTMDKRGMYLIGDINCSSKSVLDCKIEIATKLIPLIIEERIRDKYATFCQLWKRVDDGIDPDDTIGILTESRVVIFNGLAKLKKGKNEKFKSESPSTFKDPKSKVEEDGWLFNKDTHTNLQGEKDDENHGKWILEGQFTIK